MRVTREDRIRFLSNRLTSWRYHWNLSQSEAAQFLEVSLRTYQRWELGETCPSDDGWAWVVIHTRSDIRPFLGGFLVEVDRRGT